MKFMLKTAILAALTLALIVSAAMAMPVRSATDPIALTATAVSDGQPVDLEAEAFQLLGLDADGNYLIYADQGFYTVAAPAMASVVAQIDPALAGALPNLAEMDTLARGGRKSDAVIRFQQAMIDTGHLTGTADGDYGGATERAVIALQAELDLEQTGQADPMLQALVISMSQPEQTVDGAADAGNALYETVAAALGVDAQAMIDAGLAIQYDDISGDGFISGGRTLTYEAPAESDIDFCQLSLDIGLTLADEEGKMVAKPAAKVSCRCIRRPVLTQLTLKSGSHRGTVELKGLTTTVDGAYTVESATVILDSQMIEALKGAAEAGELKARVTGRYNSFDLAADKAFLPAATAIGNIAAGMGK